MRTSRAAAAASVAAAAAIAAVGMQPAAAGSPRGAASEPVTAVLESAAARVAAAAATGPGGVRTTGPPVGAPRGPDDADDADDSRPGERGASCNAWISGSRAHASCFNPDPGADRVQLHVDCARWWDPDLDGHPVEVGPAQHIRLSQRCWKEIREAWVSHRPER
ncbi:hypothetical protein [Streptomyces sp. NPDC018031]|uniref:hypothetical protein n=1 Tax=Streptomyces sp. NPDC018031 TaxID=3365033 RepID=UPI0037ABED67